MWRFAKNTATLFLNPGQQYLPIWYSFRTCLDCNRELCVRWPGLIFPLQRLDRCAQRRSTKAKQTALREHVGQSGVQLSHTGLAEDSYVDGERDTFPRNELLWDESLVWASQMTRDPICICAGAGAGGPWSRALCLPARIPGSRVGVAGEAHHSAPGCFASEVKRAPQMSRHCHSSNLSPQELQRWATGGPSRCAEFAAYVYFKYRALAVLCFKTQFEILVLPVCLCLKVLHHAKFTFYQCFLTIINK